MSALPPLLSHPLAEHLGWTLLHFLWQGAALALLCAAVLVMLKRRSANARYLVCGLVLVCMLVAPIATFFVIGGEAEHAPAQSSHVIAGLTTEPSPVAPPPHRLLDESPLSAAPANAVRKAGPPATASLGLADRLRPWTPWCSALWALGVLVLSLRLLGGWLRLRILVRRKLQPLSREMQAVLVSAARRLSVSRPVRGFISAMVEVPSTIGWLRPVILLPASALSGLSMQQIEAILAHELAHIRRHDYLVNLLQSIFEVVLFYHPAVWWVSRRIRQEREHCCDDLALALCPDAPAYARALATLEEHRTRRYSLAPASQGGGLAARIRRILGRRGSAPQRSTSFAGFLLVLLIAGFLTGLTLSRDSQAQPVLAAAPGSDVSAATDEDPLARYTTVISAYHEEERAYNEALLKLAEGYQSSGRVYEGVEYFMKLARSQEGPRDRRVLQKIMAEFQREYPGTVAKVAREMGLAPPAAEQSADAAHLEGILARIRESDTAKRKEAMTDLRALLEPGASDESKEGAMHLLLVAASHRIEFDRAAFRQRVVPLLQSENANLRAGAISLLPLLASAPDDATAVAALLREDSPKVRQDAGAAFTRMQSEAIIQRQDSKLRDETLAQLEAMLAPDASTDIKAVALQTLGRSLTAKFDRAPFRALVLPLLQSEDESVRTSAVSCLSGLEPTLDDLPQVAALAEDASPEVRKAAGQALIQIGKGKRPEIVVPALTRLLADEDKEVTVAVIRGMWGQYSTPEFDELLIKLSNDPEFRGITLYHALSTMPKKSPAVCKRLVEELDNPDWNDSGRAAWGLTYGVGADGRAMVEEGLLKALPEETNSYTRRQEFNALGKVAGEKSRPYLESVVASPMESDDNKKVARGILKRLSSNE